MTNSRPTGRASRHPRDRSQDHKTRLLNGLRDTGQMSNSPPTGSAPATVVHTAEANHASLHLSLA